MALDDHSISSVEPDMEMWDVLLCTSIFDQEKT